MASKSEMKTMAQIALYKKNGGEKDLIDTSISRQDFILKKIVINLIIVFLISFSIISFKRVASIYFIQDLFTKEYFLKLFVSSILMSFVVTSIYAVLTGIYYSNIYSKKESNVRAYYLALEKTKSFK